MAESKVMLFKADEKMNIKCRFISELFKIDFYTSAAREGLLLETKKHHPDVVFLDLNLYARIDGTKTSKTI